MRHPELFVVSSPISWCQSKPYPIFFAVLTSFQSILTVLLPARSCSGHSFCCLPSAVKINLDIFPQTHMLLDLPVLPHTASASIYWLLNTHRVFVCLSSNWTSLENAHVY